MPQTYCQSSTSCMGWRLKLEPTSTLARLHRWVRAPSLPERCWVQNCLRLGLMSLAVDSTIIGKEVQLTPGAVVVRGQLRTVSTSGSFCRYLGLRLVAHLAPRLGISSGRDPHPHLPELEWYQHPPLHPRQRRRVGVQELFTTGILVPWVSQESNISPPKP
jgi:hypothetical protein